MEKRFSVWALMALMVLAFSVTPASAQWATWDAAADAGANGLDLNAPPFIGLPIPVLDSDTVDSPVVPGSPALPPTGYFDDWGCMAQALVEGENTQRVLYPGPVTTTYPVVAVGMGSIPGNYYFDDAIELGDPAVYPFAPAPGMDAAFPLVAPGVPTHGAMRHMDLAFLANRLGVGGDGLTSAARAFVQWGEMKASGAAGHNSMAGWPSAYWGVFEAYASLNGLGTHFDNLNSSIGVGDLALFGHAIRQIDPAFLLTGPPSLSDHLVSALTTLTNPTPPNAASDCLYYWALGLAVREFAAENDLLRVNAWVPVLLAAQQGDGGWYDPLNPCTVCDKAMNTAAAMLALDAVSESFYAVPLKAGATWMVNNITMWGANDGGWCGSPADQWPVTAMFKFLQDTTPPTVWVNSPAPGGTICGAAVLIDATVGDNVDVQQVEFTVNGIVVSTDLAAPWQYTYDTTATGDCTHVIGVTAYDYAGNTTTTTVSVEIDNTPPAAPVFVTPAAPGTCVSGNYVLEVTAADNKAVCAVEYYATVVAPANLIGTAVGGPPWTLDWDTTDSMGGIVVDGALNVIARSLDCCPTAGPNTTIGVVVDNTPPTAVLQPPMDTAACLQDTETFTVVAADGGCGVAQVDFTLGALSFTDTSAPYSWTVSTASLADGAATLSYWSTDSAGNPSTPTGTKAYTVNNLGPSVSITAPGDGSTVSGAAVTLSAAGSDADWGLLNVAFYLDAVPPDTAAVLIATDPLAPYNVLWNSTGASDGAHLLYAVATDNSVAIGGCGTARTALDSITVTVDNTPPPAPTITSPTGGATVCGVLTVQVTATDPGSGIASVAVYLDAVAPANLLGTDVTAPYEVLWNTALATPGAHTLFAVATDNIGQSATSAGTAVTVDNTTNPVVTLTAPAPGAVSGSVAVTATATDANGVQNVEFWLDNDCDDVGDVLLGDDTTAPYAIAWDSTATADCTHCVMAVGFDVCGLSDVDTVQVLVDNTPPAVTILTPTAGSTVSGTLTPPALASVSISVSATDTHGAAGTTLFVDVWHMAPGPPYPVALAMPFAAGLTPPPIVWNTAASHSGTIELRAYGTDGVGNSGAATPTTLQFTVNNASFADVPYNYWAWLYVERIARTGVTTGCIAGPPAEYCPATSVTRAQMAVFICRALGLLPDPAPPQVFLDVPPAHWAYGYIQKFFRSGLTSGCFYDPISGDRNYCPGDNVTRAQMAVFIVRSLGLPPISPCTGVFVDVPVGAFACGYIEKMFALGITGGCSTVPLNYCPNDDIRRDQMAVFLVRAYAIGPPP